MLDRASGVPLHAQLKSVLCEQIATGALPPRAKLPSERELCRQYGVSRITVRRALAEMAQEGWVYSSVGKGTYVRAAKVDSELRPLTGFTEEMRQKGLTVSSQVLENVLVHADMFLAERLQVPRSSEVVKLRRLRVADGIPYAVQVAYLPHVLCPGILRFDFSQSSLFDILRTVYGLCLAKADMVIEAVLAQPEEASLLQLDGPAAVLVTEQTTYLDNGVPIEWVRSIFRGDCYKIRTRVP